MALAFGGVLCPGLPGSRSRQPSPQLSGADIPGSRPRRRRRRSTTFSPGIATSTTLERVKKRLKQRDPIQMRIKDVLNRRPDDSTVEAVLLPAQRVPTVILGSMSQGRCRVEPL